MSKIFNDYGVLVDKDIHSTIDSLYNDVRGFLLSNDFTIQELMILERNVLGQISGAFADRILTKQMEKRNEDNNKKK